MWKVSTATGSFFRQKKVKGKLGMEVFQCMLADFGQISVNRSQV